MLLLPHPGVTHVFGARNPSYPRGMTVEPVQIQAALPKLAKTATAGNKPCPQLQGRADECGRLGPSSMASESLPFDPPCLRNDPSGTGLACALDCSLEAVSKPITARDVVATEIEIVLPNR